MKWILFLFFGVACSPQSNEIWSVIPEPDLIPEGIAFDPVDETFYLSSTFKRKVVSINRHGEIQDFTTTAQDGLWGVVGMEVDAARRFLWVASSHAGSGMPMINEVEDEYGSSGVFKYDLSTGAFIRKYVVSGDAERHFFNDLTVASDGTVYITDSAANAIYRIGLEADTLELYLKPEGMPSPNGITLSDDQQHLFIALRGDIGKLSIRDRELSLITRPTGIAVGADGLYFYEQSLITVWPGSEQHGVTRYVLNDALDTILRVEPILAEHPAFLQPTTGAIVDSDIFVVANSQLQVFRRLYEETVPVDLTELVEPVVLRVSLDEGA